VVRAEAVGLWSLEAISIWCCSEFQDPGFCNFLFCQQANLTVFTEHILYKSSCVSFQKVKFRHNKLFLRPKLDMLSFLCLPRELRDLIYDECFVAVKPMDLQNLAPSLERPVSRRLCLTPNFLASCRQVYEEGMTKLYGENLYFVDLTSSWRFARSVQWP
jgi:hypothetical protein